MALERPYREAFKDCGCFESRASGAGMARAARELMESKRDYKGILKTKTVEELTATVLLAAYEDKDPIALEVIGQSVELWGMGVANLVSLFNPEKIIVGGGVFGPAVKLIPLIYEEALKWAQPVSIRKLVLEPAGLGVRAALYGAALRALQNKNQDANTTF
jgi:glucokinase